MSELEKQFERLMNFAQQGNFHKPFSKVYFLEEKSIRYFHDTNHINEISRPDISDFENFENRFHEILDQGYSWININFAGMLGDSLLIIIESPVSESDVKLTSVNLSLPNMKVIENDWDASPYYQITD